MNFTDKELKVVDELQILRAQRFKLNKRISEKSTSYKKHISVANSVKQIVDSDKQNLAGIEAKMVGLRKRLLQYMQEENPLITDISPDLTPVQQQPVMLGRSE